MATQNEAVLDGDSLRSFLQIERAGVGVDIAAEQNNIALTVGLRDIYGSLSGSRYTRSTETAFHGDHVDRLEIDKFTPQTIVYQLYNPNPNDRPDRSTVVLEVRWDDSAQVIRVAGFGFIL